MSEVTDTFEGMAKQFPSAKGQGNEILVRYQYMTADEVAKLKEQVVSDSLADKLTWGTYGPQGADPLKKKPLCELNTDHLEAILITQPHISPEYRATILQLLYLRITENE